MEGPYNRYLFENHSIGFRLCVITWPLFVFYHVFPLWFWFIILYKYILLFTHSTFTFFYITTVDKKS